MNVRTSRVVIARLTMLLVGGGYAAIAATAGGSSPDAVITGTAVGLTAYLVMRTLGSALASRSGGTRFSTAVGFGTLAMGVGALLWTIGFAWGVAVVSLGVLGAAAGWLDVFLNAGALRSGSELGLRRLQGMFSVGALVVAGVAWIVRSTGLPLRSIPLALGLAAVCLAALWMRGGNLPVEVRHANVLRKGRWAVAPIAVAAYIGAEVSMSSLLPNSAAAEPVHSSLTWSASLLAAFWLGFTAARFVPWPSRVDVPRLVGIALIPALALGAVGPAALHVVAFLLIGFLAGPVFPSLLRWFAPPGQEQMSSGVFIVAATIGGAVLPLVIARVLVAAGVGWGTAAVALAALPACAILVLAKRGPTGDLANEDEDDLQRG